MVPIRILRLPTKALPVEVPLEARMSLLSSQTLGSRADSFLRFSMGDWWRVGGVLPRYAVSLRL